MKGIQDVVEQWRTAHGGKVRVLAAMPTMSQLPLAPIRTMIFDTEPGRHCFAHFRNVSVILWAARADGAAMQRMRKLTEYMIRQFPQGHSNVSFVPKGVGPPTEDARPAFAYAFNGKISDLRCLSVVVEGEGFWASTLRSTITSMQLPSDRSLQLSLDASIEEAMAWLPKAHRERTGIAITPEEFQTTLLHAREVMFVAVTKGTQSQPPSI